MDNVASPKGTRPTPSARSGLGCIWGAHAALLVIVGGFTGLCAFMFTTPDANIGLGMGLVALGTLGAPWTVPLFSNEGLSFDSGLFVVVAAGGAVLNLALHAAVSRWWRARTQS